MNQKDQYEVTIPLSKDQFVSSVKESTYELNVQNQSYRKSYLANIRGEEISVAYSLGLWDDGGGLEFFRAMMIEDGDSIRLIGEFEVLPQIRFGATLFLGAVVAGILFFLLSNIASAITAIIIFLLPTVLVYRNLPKLVASQAGRIKVFEYFESKFNGVVKKL